MSDEKEKVCVLCSGGMDSSFMLVLLSEAGYEVLPCYMDYGQKVKVKEVAALRAFCEKYGFAEPRIFHIPMHDVFGDFWAVKGDTIPEYTGDIAKEYIPARNILFITKLAAFMQLNGIEKLALGAQATDCMPDNNRRFFDTMEETLAIGMGALPGVGKLKPIKYKGEAWRLRILSPLVQMRKADVAEGFRGRNLDPTLTWSCYDYKDEHCGVCWQCYERHEAFHVVGMVDPTVYLEPVKLKKEGEPEQAQVSA